MRKRIIASAFALTMTLAFAGATYAVHLVGPADLVLEADRHAKPARFPHHAHQQMMECGECHHGEENGQQVPYREGMEIQGCETCHNKQMENDKLDSYREAAHENCQGCHRRVNAAEGKNAPTKCSGCHIKK